MRNRLHVMLAACTFAGCVDRTDDAPLFGSEPMDKDDLIVDIDALAAEVKVDVITTLAAAPRPGDRDGDYLGDAYDTCPDVEDSSNFDSDLDGVGNACDADYDNNGFVSGSDYAVLIAAFGHGRGDPAYDARADHDHDGFVSGADFAVFLRYFGATLPPHSTIAMQQAAVGDELVANGRFTSGTLLGLMGMRSTISAVERDANGRIVSITAGGGIRLVAWSPEAWVFEGLLYTAGGALGVCPRSIVFPARPVDTISQFCSSTTYQSFALAVSRP